MNFTSLSFSVSIYLNIPFWGKVLIGSGSGNLETGVKISVGVDGIAKGSLTFVMRNRVELWVIIALDTIIGNWHTEVHLFDF